MIFIDKDLSDREKLIVLAHEINHIVYKHIHSGLGTGFNVQDEYEANEFTHFLLNPPFTLTRPAKCVCPMNDSEDTKRRR